MTNKEYDSLLKYTIHLIHKFPHIIADDVVNDVLLIEMQSGKPFNEVDVKKQISKYCKEAIHNKRSENENIKYDEAETRKFCKGCNEDLPVGAFSIVNRYKEGTKELFHICKDCQAKRMKEYYSSEKFSVALKKRATERAQLRIEQKLEKEGKRPLPKINPMALLNMKNYRQELINLSKRAV